MRYVGTQKGVSGFISYTFLVKKFRRRMNTMGNNANTSIKCTVKQCRNHCQDKEYCSLDCISIGTHESNPTQDQCTDCLSFQKK